MADDYLDEKVTVELALDAIALDFGTLQAMWESWQAKAKGQPAGKPASIPKKPDLVVTGSGANLKVTVARDGFPAARAVVEEIEASSDLGLKRRVRAFLKAFDDRERLLESVGVLLVKMFADALGNAKTPITPVTAASLVADYAKESGLAPEKVTFLGDLVKGKLVSAPRGKVALEDLIKP